jgi:hypothetical protein
MAVTIVKDLLLAITVMTILVILWQAFRPRRRRSRHE